METTQGFAQRSQQHQMYCENCGGSFLSRSSFVERLCGPCDRGGVSVPQNEQNASEGRTEPLRGRQKRRAKKRSADGQSPPVPEGQSPPVHHEQFDKQQELNAGSLSRVARDTLGRFTRKSDK